MFTITATPFRFLTSGMYRKENLSEVTMKSVLMIGQSNMAGRGFLNEVPMICNERIQMLRNGRWQMMADNDRAD